MDMINKEGGTLNGSCKYGVDKAEVQKYVLVEFLASGPPEPTSKIVFPVLLEF